MTVTEPKISPRGQKGRLAVPQIAGPRHDQTSNAPSPPAGEGVEVRLDGIRHGFFHAGEFVRVVWDVSLAVPPGQLLCIVGPSGCGKTTLLSMIAGLLQPQAGEVSVNGTAVQGPSHDVGYMLARDALLPWRSVQQNVELGLEVQGVAKSERRSRSTEWLQRVGLADFADSKVAALSQGMRQRVAIARTLVLRPRCLLMDEPFAALDAQMRTLQQQQFIELWEKQRSTAIFITHDLREAILLGDRVMLMGSRPGTIIADIEIDIDRPRRLEEQEENPDFLAYYADLHAQLRAEVSRTMQLQNQRRQG